MWNKKKCILSLFAGMNQGKIIDCHGTISVPKKKYQHPFCTQDTGTIESTANETGHTEELQKEEKQSQKQPEVLENVIEISSTEQLTEIAKQVNLGDSFYYNGTYKLTADLDLQNKKWIPMGVSELTPFCGTFDGNGHSIKNVSVQGNTKSCAGFFGYLKKADIRNLSVEGKINGGKYTGAIAGICEDSKISSCFASAKIYGSYCAGGFIGKNTGEITHCYYSGTIQYKSKHPLTITAAAVVVVTGGVLSFLVLTKPHESGNKFYPPVPVDKEAVQFEEQDPVKDRNKLACSFSTRIVADKGDGEAGIIFKNPGKSNKHIILELQITDEELIKTIGKSGRTEEEQKKLDDSGTYHPENSRQVIAKSGTIPPGFELKEVEMQALPDGTILPAGKYQAIVYLVMYDVFTNKKEIINTNTLVTLEVEN